MKRQRVNYMNDSASTIYLTIIVPVLFQTTQCVPENLRTIYTCYTILYGTPIRTGTGLTVTREIGLYLPVQIFAKRNFGGFGV